VELHKLISELSTDIRGLDQSLERQPLAYVWAKTAEQAAAVGTGRRSWGVG
jgi:hypothetical protein